MNLTAKRARTEAKKVAKYLRRKHVATTVILFGSGGFSSARLVIPASGCGSGNGSASAGWSVMLMRPCPSTRSITAARHGTRWASNAGPVDSQSSTRSAPPAIEGCRFGRCRCIQSSLTLCRSTLCSTSPFSSVRPSASCHPRSCTPLSWFCCLDTLLPLCKRRTRC